MSKKTSKITDKQARLVIEAAKLGASRRDCAVYAGISMDRLAEVLETDPLFTELFERYTVERKLDALRKIQEGDKGWQSGAWYLEKRYRKEYGEQRRLPAEEEKRTIKTRLVQAAPPAKQLPAPGQVVRATPVKEDLLKRAG